jgi:hypothetical protein
MGGGDRLQPLETGFDHAALVIGAGLVTVFIAKMDFQASDTIGKPVQSTYQRDLNLLCQLFMSLNISVRVNLNLHAALPF